MPQKIKEITRLPLNNDYVFKRVFAHEGNEDILKDFLEAILHIKIQKIEVQNPELPKNYKEEKKGTLDIKIQLNENTLIDVEMQVENEENIDSRSTTYLGKLVANQLHPGDVYTKLKKSITICILNFEFYKTNNYHNIAKMKFDEATKETYIDMGYKEEENIASSYIEMHFIELPKFIKKNPEAKTKLEQWLWLLAGKEEKIEMAKKENEEVKKAVEVLNVMSMDPKERERCESIAMYEFFRQDAERIKFEKGLKQGKEEGKEEGKKEKQKEIAKKMLKLGIDRETIEEVTELSKEEIEKL